MITIAIYSRKSKFTGKGDSIANQIELCRQEAQVYLKSKKITESDAKIIIYEDEGYSGKNTARPEFQKMMTAIKANKINCVICYKLDRISRNVGDFARTFEELEKRDIAFVCVNDRCDTSTPSGRAMMGMVTVFAQMEREVIAERIRDNMHMLARSGRWLGGITPTGFKSLKIKVGEIDEIAFQETMIENEESLIEDLGAEINKKARTAYKLVPVQKELELVKFIYEKFIELKSVSGTMKYLVKNSIKTKNGLDFTPIAVKAILRNPVYCCADIEANEYFSELGADICYEETELDGKHGFMPFNRTSRGKINIKKNKTSNWIIAVGRHEGIIPSDVWVKIQRLLDAKRERNEVAVRTPYKSEALLSGLLVCGKCGSFMRPHVHAKRISADGVVPYYYICTLKENSSKARCDMQNVAGAVIDKTILDEFSNYDSPNSSIHDSLVRRSKGLENAKEKESNKRGHLESELDTKKKLMDKLMQKLMRNLMESCDAETSADAFTTTIKSEYNRLDAECRQLQMEIDKTALSSTIYEDYESQMQAVVGTLKKLSSTILTATTVEKRELLKSMVERIVWDGEQADIFLLGESPR